MGEGARGSSSATPPNDGDFEIVAALLRSSPGIDAASLAALATSQFGATWDKKRVNGVVYRMETAGLVAKLMQGAKPLWQLRG